MALVVILPGPEDLGAGQVASGLRRRGVEVVVVPGHLLEVARWEHHITDGLPHSEIRLPSGVVLSDENVSGILNRLPGASVRRFAGSLERDRSYAAVEWEALLLAWLSSMGERVVGCPSPAVLSMSAPLVGSDGGVDLRWRTWGWRWGLLGPRSVSVPQAHWADVHRGDGETHRWSVVGATVLRDDHVAEGDTASAVRALAWAAGVDLVDVILRRTSLGDELVAVDLRPALTPGVSEAVAELLVGCSRHELGAAS